MTKPRSSQNQYSHPNTIDHCHIREYAANHGGQHLYQHPTCINEHCNHYSADNRRIDLSNNIGGHSNTSIHSPRSVLKSSPLTLCVCWQDPSNTLERRCSHLPGTTFTTTSVFTSTYPVTATETTSFYTTNTVVSVGLQLFLCGKNILMTQYRHIERPRL